jgi:hypothetical protein
MGMGPVNGNGEGSSGFVFYQELYKNKIIDEN